MDPRIMERAAGCGCKIKRRYGRVKSQQAKFFHIRTQGLRRYMNMKFIIVLIGVIVSVGGKTQVHMYNLSLTDSTLPLLYVGVDNRLILVGGAYDVSKYEMNVSDAASVTKIGINEYQVRVGFVGICTVTYKEDGKIRFQKSYKTAYIPDPIATVNGFWNTSLSKAKLTLNPFLRVLIPNCYYRFHYEVISFYATFIRGFDSVSLATKSKLLSKEQIKMLGNLESGDTIFFDKIYVIGPESHTRVLAPFWIKIE
jgi:hypothetical protein